jgi:hypothetical protein
MTQALYAHINSKKIKIKKIGMLIKKRVPKHETTLKTNLNLMMRNKKK